MKQKYQSSTPAPEKISLNIHFTGLQAVVLSCRRLGFLRDQGVFSSHGVCLRGGLKVAGNATINPRRHVDFPSTDARNGGGGRDRTTAEMVSTLRGEVGEGLSFARGS